MGMGRRLATEGWGWRFLRIFVCCFGGGCGMISWLQLLSRCDRCRYLRGACGWHGCAGTSGEDIVWAGYKTTMTSSPVCLG